LSEKGFLTSSILLFKSRKEVIFGVTWPTTLATLIAGKGFPPISKTLLSIFAIMMLSLSVYIYNDIIDRKMDAYSNKEKKKGRPIAHGVVSVENAKLFVIFTSIIGLSISLLLGRVVFFLGIIYSILFYLYSYPRVRFKEKFIMKNVITSLVFPAGLLLGGAAIEGTISPIILFLAVTEYIFMFLILPVGADYLDLEEDKAFNIKTIGGTLSWRNNIILFNIGVIVIILSTAISYFLFDISYISFILMAVFGVPLMLYSINLIKENGITAAYKLRPIGYTYLMLTPLFITIGVIF